MATFKLLFEIRFFIDNNKMAIISDRRKSYVKKNCSKIYRNSNSKNTEILFYRTKLHLNIKRKKKEKKNKKKIYVHIEWNIVITYCTIFIELN
jgi:hypothetical protein